MATLSIHEYIKHLLTGVKDGSGDVEVKQDNMLIANVLQLKPEEQMIYSRKIVGSKSLNVFLEFSKDMVGSTDKQKLSPRAQPTGALEYKTTVEINLMCAKCPGKVGAEHIQDLINECKRRAIKAKIQIKFAHSYSWDNKYNRLALKRLSTLGVALSPMCLNMMLTYLMNDVEETILSFDQLQTCRGTLVINDLILKHAVNVFRSSIYVNVDKYFKEQNSKLNEILELDTPEKTQNDTSSHQASTLSMATYRDYFLLQNGDHVWGKLKVEVTRGFPDGNKIKNVYETLLYSEVTNNNVPRHSIGKKIEKTDKNILDRNNIWNKISNEITMKDLSECSRIGVNLNVLLSEYPDPGGRYQEVKDLHEFLEEKIEECDLMKVRTDIRVRFAQCGNQISNGDVASQRTTECLHVQDILFEMLEDLEDNLHQLGREEYNRGCSLEVNKDEITTGMGVLNKSIRIQVDNGEDVKEFSMNDDFTDEYADEINDG